MFYKPSKERQWDSWIFRQGDTYFMYYINVSEGGTRWDGISLAVSRDLVHWEEVGRVLAKDEDAVWLGTGMVYRAGARYLMNYSMEKPARCQRIYFAESYDLYHWSKVEGAVSAPDGEIYQAAPDACVDIMPRWDSLGVIRPFAGSPPYYAFCSANAAKAAVAGKSGVLGLATSEDGLRWRCLPPAFGEEGVFPACEVPEHVSFGGRHYALFCTSSYLGHRFDPRMEWSAGGTYYLVADKSTGPYRLPEGDPMLQGTRDHAMVCMNYVGRTFEEDGKRLYYHIWGAPDSDAWMGPVKELYEERPYRLGLRYYAGNERMKGRKLLAEIRAERCTELLRAGCLPAVDWSFERGGVRFTGNGSAMCLCHANVDGAEQTPHFADLADGRVLECTVRLEGRAAGVCFCTRGGDNLVCAAINAEKQRLEWGYLRPGWAGGMVLHLQLSHPLRFAGSARLRLLARREFLEAYVNDLYVGGWRLEAGEGIDPNRFGLYAEDSDGSFEGLTVWEMK